MRHAYFTGAAKDGEGPYDKLKRALRADIDEAAWSSLYSTVSCPFDHPESGKIAIKVINHYGDEVLKVFDVQRVGHWLVGTAPRAVRNPCTRIAARSGNAPYIPDRR